MPRQPEVNLRTAWHKTSAGCWSLSLGERGTRVRVTQRAPGGTFFRMTWVPGEGRSQASLHTTSRTIAKQRAEQLCRALASGDARKSSPVPLTLAELWRRYESEAAKFKRNKPKTKEDKRGRIKFLLRGLGPDLLVTNLCKNLADTYA